MRISDESDVSEQDLAFLRRAIDLARAARADGRHPFGALIVNERGETVVESMNNAVRRKGDPMQHAETVACAAAARLLSSRIALYIRQKGVDMRIGLDIAAYSALRNADRIALVTADTDCVAAMKLARKSGVQVVLVALPNGIVPGELQEHADYVRPVILP
jgi:uncharacterized LabA/DUF88 family protein